MNLPFPFGFPAATQLYLVLLVVTLLVHMVFMHYVLAGTAYLACGRLDGFWELFLKPWDMAAGMVIIKEAGGTVTSFDGTPFDLYGTEILASNGVIHDQMMEVLAKGKRGKKT